MSYYPDFKLWEKEQFTIEFSRCRSLADITIVGKRENIKSIIKEIFTIENSALRKVVERLNHLNILEDIEDQESIQEDLATFN